MPVALLILLAVVDFGRAFYDYERITNAAREGAMWLARYPSSTQAHIQARVGTEGGLCADGNPVQVASFSIDGGQAVVSVQCRFDLYTPVMGAILGTQQLTLSSSARMPRLQQF